MAVKPDELFFSKTSDYLNVFLPLQAAKSPNTVRTYRHDLSCFYDYVAGVAGISPERFRFTDCDYKFLLGYSQYMQTVLNWSAETVNQHITAVRSYLKYAADCRIDVMQVYLSVKAVPAVPVTRRIRPIVEEEDLKAFLSAPADTKLGRRDQVILILLFDAALRVSELAGITLADIRMDRENPVILIHGKGRKERFVELSPDAGEHLKAYLDSFHRDARDLSVPLFYTVIHGSVNPMSVRNIQRIVSKYGRSVQETSTTMPDVHPHMLRRTRATGLYRDGVPLSLVSTFLGHSSVETTRIYASPSAEQIRDSTRKTYSDSGDTPVWKKGAADLKARYGLK